MLVATLQIVVALAICAVGANFLTPAVIWYDITEPCLCINLFGILPLMRIGLRGATVRRVGHLEYFGTLAMPRGFRQLWVVNRVFTRGYVMISRDKGFFRHIVISPSRPEEFMKRLIAAGAKAPMK